MGPFTPTSSDPDFRTYSLIRIKMTSVKDLPHTTVWTKQLIFGPKKRCGLGPDQTEPWHGLCSHLGWFGLSDHLQEVSRRSSTLNLNIVIYIVILVL